MVRGSNESKGTYGVRRKTVPRKCVRQSRWNLEEEGPGVVENSGLIKIRGVRNGESVPGPVGGSGLVRSMWWIVPLRLKKMHQEMF